MAKRTTTVTVFVALITRGSSRHGSNLCARSTRLAIYARDGFVCTYCGCELMARDAVLDHVVPRSHGGSSHPSNLVTSCESCNRSKSEWGVAEWASVAFGDEATTVLRAVRNARRRQLQRATGRMLARLEKATKTVAKAA